MDLPTDLRAEFSSPEPDSGRIRTGIIELYNRTHGTQIDPTSDLPEAEAKAVISWLRANDPECQIAAGVFIKKTILHSVFSLSLSDKISSIAQYNCPICTVSCPISTIPLRIAPQSYQAEKSKVVRAFKRAISHRLANQASERSYFGKQLCLHIVFVMSSKRKDKDVDNMAKLILDALKQVLFEDDKDIVHLSLMKVRQDEEDEFVFLNIRQSRLNDHADVLTRRFYHGWGEGSLINIEDFFE